MPSLKAVSAICHSISSFSSTILPLHFTVLQMFINTLIRQRYICNVWHFFNIIILIHKFPVFVTPREQTTINIICCNYQS